VEAKRVEIYFDSRGSLIGCKSFAFISAAVYEKNSTTARSFDLDPIALYESKELALSTELSSFSSVGNFGSKSHYYNIIKNNQTKRLTFVVPPNLNHPDELSIISGNYKNMVSCGVDGLILQYKSGNIQIPASALRPFKTGCKISFNDIFFEKGSVDELLGIHLDLSDRQNSGVVSLRVELAGVYKAVGIDRLVNSSIGAIGGYNIKYYNSEHSATGFSDRDIDPLVLVLDLPDFFTSLFADNRYLFQPLTNPYFNIQEIVLITKDKDFFVLLQTLLDFPVLRMVRHDLLRVGLALVFAAVIFSLTFKERIFNRFICNEGLFVKSFCHLKSKAIRLKRELWRPYISYTFLILVLIIFSFFNRASGMIFSCTISSILLFLSFYFSEGSRSSQVQLSSRNDKALMHNGFITVLIFVLSMYFFIAQLFSFEIELSSFLLVLWSFIASIFYFYNSNQSPAFTLPFGVSLRSVIFSLPFIILYILIFSNSRQSWLTLLFSLSCVGFFVIPRSYFGDKLVFWTAGLWIICCVCYSLKLVQPVAVLAVIVYAFIIFFVFNFCYFHIKERNVRLC